MRAGEGREGKGAAQAGSKRRYLRLYLLLLKEAVLDVLGDRELGRAVRAVPCRSKSAQMGAREGSGFRTGALAGGCAKLVDGSAGALLFQALLLAFGTGAACIQSSMKAAQ